MCRALCLVFYILATVANGNQGPFRPLALHRERSVSTLETKPSNSVDHDDIYLSVGVVVCIIGVYGSIFAIKKIMKPIVEQRASVDKVVQRRHRRPVDRIPSEPSVDERPIDEIIAEKRAKAARAASFLEIPGPESDFADSDVESFDFNESRFGSNIL